MTEIVSSVADLSRSEWNGLCSGRPHASYGWLRTVAESAVEPPDYRFFLVRDGGKLVGAAACYRLRGGMGDGFERRLFGRVAPVARTVGLGFGPALVCGFGAAHGGTGILIAQELGAEQRHDVRHRLITALERDAEEHEQSLIFNNVLETESWQALLHERGYARTMTTPSVVVRMNWLHFEGYLAYVRAGSRNAGRSITKEMGRCAASGTVIRQARLGGEATKGAYELLDAHCRYKNNEAFPFGSNFLAALQAHCGDESELYLAIVDGRLAAVTVTLSDTATLWNAFVGMDRALCADNFAYFNVVFYAPLREAARAGIQEMVLGPGAYEAKLVRGGRLVRRYVFVRQRGHSKQWVTRRALRFLETVHGRRYAALYQRDRELGDKRAGHA